jgi:hypothetical protein
MCAVNDRRNSLAPLANPLRLVLNAANRTEEL